MEKEKAIAIATKFAQKNRQKPIGAVKKCFFVDYSEIAIIEQPLEWTIVFSAPGEEGTEQEIWVCVDDKTGSAYMPLRM